MASDSGDLEASGPGLLAEIRDLRQANTGSFNAMREDLNDLRAHVDRGFVEMRGRLDAAAAGQQQIVDLIQTLIEGRRHG
ncbi:hypothetical protein [Mycobacterium sp. C31M]